MMKQLSLICKMLFLSNHDFILLGLRGQAKSRILQSLVNLLDEYIPNYRGK